MAWIYSTGAINLLSAGWPTRKAFSDFVLDLYGASAPPATADAAATGTKLCRITVGSAAVTLTSVSTGSYLLIKGTAQSYTAVLANRTNTNTVKFTVTIDGNGGVTATYTLGTVADSSDVIAAANVARWLEDQFPQLQCVPYAALSFAIKCKIDGLSLTVADGSGSTAVTVTQIQAAARTSIYTLLFGPAVAGVISKNSDVWSGVGLVTGVATYGRLVLPTDDATLSTSQIRAQGAISTSGAEITMSNTTVTLGATSTVDAASITKPSGA